MGWLPPLKSHPGAPPKRRVPEYDMVKPVNHVHERTQEETPWEADGEGIEPPHDMLPCPLVSNQDYYLL